MSAFPKDGRNRPYIERLQHDPRVRMCFDSWVHQATLEAEARFPDQADGHKAAHHAARRAIELAASFLLDEDAEYRAALAENDQLRDLLLEQTRKFSPAVILQASNPSNKTA